MSLLLAALALQAAAAPAATQPPVAPTAIIAAAPATDWVTILPEDLLVMDLAPDAAGRPRRVVIQLMPPPFSQSWVDNIRTLARAHWWDGTSVNRVQDNYVAQWGDATEKKPLPPGLVATSGEDYRVKGEPVPLAAAQVRALGPGNDTARHEAAWRGFPIETLGTGAEASSAPVHCYAMVGVGRGLAPDAGTGAELYTVIGHAPRHLDRNIALVGRVIAGIEYLSSLPRGTEALGFYKTEAERMPIARIRLASDMAPTERPAYQYLSTDNASFARYVAARANRRDDFFVRPAGRVDICNAPVPVRPRP